MTKTLKILGISAVALCLLAGCAQSSKVTQDKVHAAGISSTGTAGESGTSLQAADRNANTVYGKITAIDGKKITIAEGTLKEMQGGKQPDGQNQNGNGQQPPEKPSGDISQAADQSQPSKESGQTPPGMNGEDRITLTGESKTITVTDSTKFTSGGQESKLEELKADDYITVTMDGDTVSSVEKGIRPGGTPGGEGKNPGQGGQSGESVQGSQQSSANVTTNGSMNVTATQTINKKTISSTTADDSAVVVSGGGNLTISNSGLDKTGDSSNTENSEFYGLNAVLLARENSNITASGLTITSNAGGANAVFAAGSGATVHISDSTITTEGNSSRGLDASYGGEITADNVTIATSGSHCAAAATDRGEGTILVSNSRLNTSGEGSPCIYSTGSITADTCTGDAAGSDIAVIEGKNSASVKNSTLTASGTGRANGGIDDAGILIYQSMSGDAGKGTGTFTAADSTLSIHSDSAQFTTAPMFFVTNTDAKIELKNTTLNFGSGILLRAAAASEWGTFGENGGSVLFTVDYQTLNGNITADSLSTVNLNLSNSSTLTGAVNSDNTAKEISMTIGSGCTWKLTGDSYVNTLSNNGTIDYNGYTVHLANGTDMSE